MHYASDTCDISNLPIFNGDKVVIIPLIKSTPEIIHKGINATDNFMPFAFPVFADYGEFNELHNAHTPMYNQKFLMSLKYFIKKKNNNGKDIYEPIDIGSNFNNFVTNFLMLKGELYTTADLPKVFTNGYAEVSSMIIHYDLYSKLLSEIENRKLSNENHTYGEYLCENFKNKLYDFFDEYHQLEEYEKNSEDKVEKIIIEHNQNELFENVMNHLFNSGEESNTIKLRYFIKNLARKPPPLSEA